jgi:uncharacterized protein (TIGR03437 family)
LQIVLRDTNQIPYPGVSVEFAVTTGTASLNPAFGSTNPQGTASVMVQLGTDPGPVTVLARVPGTSLSATFSLLALGTAQVYQGGVVNGASFAPGSVMLSPGSIISIFGINLSTTTASATFAPLPTSLANSRVEIQGIPAPLFYVSPTQINAQVPVDLPHGTVSLRVRNEVSLSQPVEIFLQPAGPGIFSWNSSGGGPGAITSATTQLPINEQNPSRPGEFVQIFATGLGPVTPAIPSGYPALSQPLSETGLPVTATVSGVPATVVFAGLAPGFSGLYQVNVQVPEVPLGAAEVILRVSSTSSNAVTMAVGAP